MIIHVYVNPLISIIGAILCLVSFIVFRNALFTGRFFIHVRVETMFMFINLLIVFCQPIYFGRQDDEGLGLSYIGCIYYKYFIMYAKSICETVVLYSNILLGIRFYRFISLSRRIRAGFVKKHAGLILSVSIIMFCSLIFWYQIKYISVIKKKIFTNSSSNGTDYYWTIDENPSDYLYVYAELSAIAFRDGLGTILLIIINISLLLKVTLKLYNKIFYLRNIFFIKG